MVVGSPVEVGLAGEMGLIGLMGLMKEALGLRVWVYLQRWERALFHKS